MFKQSSVDTVCHSSVIGIIGTLDNVDVVKFHVLNNIKALRQAQCDIATTINFNKIINDFSINH